MKMFNSFRADFGKTKKVREPLINLKQLSEETGIAYTTLTERLKKVDPPFEVKLKLKMTKYYSLRQMREWVDTFKDK